VGNCTVSSAATVLGGTPEVRKSADSSMKRRMTFSIYEASETSECFITQGGGTCGIGVCYTFDVSAQEIHR
jgi:hypothetical protein